MNLLIVREPHNCTEHTTPGIMYIDGDKFGYTLEDACRAHGVKIPGKTCIPAGFYMVKLTHSNRFKKVLPLIFNRSDLSVEGDGIRFTGIRFHGGNTHEETAGCPLVANNRINSDKIFSSLSNDLVIIEKKSLG